MDEQRSHAATVEINRGMKGEYSIRVVARYDNVFAAQEQALHLLRSTEHRLGIEAPWHTAEDALQRERDKEAIDTYLDKQNAKE